MNGCHYLGFRAEDRPRIEVEMGERWLPGALRSWIRRGHDWWAHIDYETSDRRHTATVPLARIRSSDPRAQAPADEVTEPAPHVG